MGRRYIATPLAVLLLTILSSTAFTTTPDTKILIRIEISQNEQLLQLKNLPVSVNFRSPEYVLATIIEADLPSLQKYGYSFEIVDTNPEKQVYYHLSKPNHRPLGSVPANVQIIHESDQDAVIKVTDEKLTELRRAGYNAAIIPSQPLALTIREKRTLAELNLQQLHNPVVTALVNQVSDAILSAGLQRLEDFVTRFSGSDSIDAASQWIHDKFSGYGYSEVEFDTLNLYVSGRMQRNVITIKRGTLYPEKIVMIGGHYDSIVHDGTDPMVYAPGVDDDGTGIMTVLEAARIMANVEFEKTVIFACWAAEEQGLYGSTYWAQKAVYQGLDIELYINLDMIGNLNHNDPVRDFNINSNPASQGYAELMQEMALTYTTLVPRILNAGGGSDHFPFMQNGYNFVYGEEGDFSPNWHKRTDTIENVDLPYFTETTRTSLATLATVAGPMGSAGGAKQVLYNTFRIDDDQSGESNGNGNHFVDAGETIELFVNLMNVGDSLAADISAVISSKDKYVTIFDSTKDFGNIASTDSVENTEPFLLAIAPETPANHAVLFSIKARDSEGGEWESFFRLKIRQPDLSYINYTIVEITGNMDQIPDPGETCNIIITLGNEGTRPASGIGGTLSCLDPDITILDDKAAFSDIAIHASGDNQTDIFSFMIKEKTLPHSVEFNLDLTEGEGYYQTQLKLVLLLSQGAVMLVIDDNGADNSFPYFEAFKQLGVPLFKWDNAKRGIIPLDSLIKYQQIIWFTAGDAKETLTEPEQTVLIDYLDQGGKLLLSGEFIGFRLRNTPLLTDYLHADFVGMQTFLFHLNSVADNPVTDIENLALQSNGGIWPTEIDPIEPAVSVLTYNPDIGSGRVISSGTAAIAVEAEAFKVFFCSFRLESIISQATRTQLFSDILGWFNGTPIDLQAILSVGKVTIDDDSQDTSQGDGDGFINPGETIELALNIRNKGKLPARLVQANLQTDTEFITFTEPSITYTEVPAAGEIEATDKFVFNVATQAPHNHPIQLQVHFEDSLGYFWEDQIDLKVQFSNTITGKITGDGTGQAITAAQINWSSLNPLPADQLPFGQVQSDETGAFTLSLPIGIYEFAATADGYIFSEPVYLELPPDTTVNLVLTSPEISVTPDSMLVNLGAGEIFLDSVIISNVKTGKLIYSIIKNKPEDTKTITNNHLLTPFSRLNFRLDEKSRGFSAEVSTATTPPNPNKWKLVHIDAREPYSTVDLYQLYIQNDNKNIFFKQTVHEPWNISEQDFGYVIFMDTDHDPKTGAPINYIGADYAVALGSLGDVVLRWRASLQDFDPITNPALHHILRPQQADSLEVGIRLNQIGRPEQINLVVVILDNNQGIYDVAPHNGLFYIPYSLTEISWLNLSSYYGEVAGNHPETVLLNFNIDGLVDGSYHTRLIIANNQPDGTAKVLPIQLNVSGTAVNPAVESGIPETFALEQNYPNPFSVHNYTNSGTVIKFQLPKAADITIKIYNMLGQQVATLLQSDQKAGYHRIHWNGRLANGKLTASGIYFYQIKAGDFIKTRKMLIMH